MFARRPHQGRHHTGKNAYRRQPKTAQNGYLSRKDNAFEESNKRLFEICTNLWHCTYTPKYRVF
ncbi:hypothetical protein MARHY1800 [Marinobacter nauticus ATCC 49840]|nr:hypothetical protein MARHY1800 [Marinobacter nauticus ATCC 49840]